MTAIVELLIQDLKDESTDIENLSTENCERVLETYKSLYNRCLNLKEEDFPTKEVHERIMRNIKMLYNSDFMLINALEFRLDSASILNFQNMRNTLNAFAVLLCSDW